MLDCQKFPRTRRAAYSVNTAHTVYTFTTKVFYTVPRPQTFLPSLSLTSSNGNDLWDYLPHQITRGPAPAISAICRRALMTCVTYSLIIASRSISAWSKCEIVKSVGEINTIRRMYWVCLYWLAVQLIFTELHCVKQFISVIDPKAYTSLSCCQISCFGLKLFLLIFLNVSCVFFLFFFFLLLSQMNLVLISTLKTLSFLSFISLEVYFGKVWSSFQPLWQVTCTQKTERRVCNIQPARQYITHLIYRIYSVYPLSLSCRFQPVWQRRDRKNVSAIFSDNFMGEWMNNRKKQWKSRRNFGPHQTRKNVLSKTLTFESLA